jgi:hypothetical protein
MARSHAFLSVMTGAVCTAYLVLSASSSPMVNWDVVGHNWDGMKLQLRQLRDVALDLEKGWRRITG